MKARKVRRLDPRGTLADNAERIVRARLDEVYAFAPAVLDERAVRELHDMRIAAKRLRYVLEVTAEPCFGPYARTATKRAKDLQDLLGEIHDCDVQLPRVEKLVTTLRDADADELRRRAGDAEDLDPALAARLPHAGVWRGLVALETYLRARRSLLYDRFLSLWREMQREGMRSRLEFAITERAHVKEPAPEAKEPAPEAREPAPQVAETPALGDRRAPMQVVAPAASNPTREPAPEITARPVASDSARPT